MKDFKDFLAEKETNPAETDPNFFSNMSKYTPVKELIELETTLKEIDICSFAQDLNRHAWGVSYQGDYFKHLSEKERAKLGKEADAMNKAFKKYSKAIADMTKIIRENEKRRE